jgi:hypothetical protein
VVGRRAQGWCAVGADDLHQLGGGVPGRLDLAGAEHDLDLGGEQLEAPELVGRLGQGPADRRRRRIGPALCQPQQRQSGLRLAAPPAGLLVGVLRRRGLPQDPVGLGLLVAGVAGGERVGAVSEPLERALGLLDRLHPCPVQVQKLGAVDQTLAGEGDHVRLLAPPCRQRLGPLLSAAQLGDLMAELDHAAVDGAGDDGRQLAGHDRHHGLVDQGKPLMHLALVDEGAALQVPREGDQVGVTGANADHGRLCRGGPPGRVVTRRELVECDRNQ